MSVHEFMQQGRTNVCVCGLVRDDPTHLSGSPEEPSCGDRLLDEIDRLRGELAGVRDSLSERAQACEDAEATAAMHATTLTRLQSTALRLISERDKAEAERDAMRSVLARLLQADRSTT